MEIIGPLPELQFKKENECLSLSVQAFFMGKRLEMQENLFYGRAVTKFNKKEARNPLKTENSQVVKTASFEIMLSLKKTEVKKHIYRINHYTTAPASVN